MSKFRLLILAVSLAFIAPVSNILAQGEEKSQERPASFADLVEKLSPAVVNVSTTQKVKAVQGFVGTPFNIPQGNLPPEMEPFRDFFERFGQMQGGQPQEREVYSLGSGFIIDASGYIITNNHVVDEAEEISITLPDKSKYKAKIIGRDKKTDLALLKVDAKKDLPFVPMGDSDSMRVGDWVIAIGNPFGLGGSVTQGIISARQRNINAGAFDDFLQTDAPINRGNSGGPLFNMKGEVIGINSAIFSPAGAGGGSVGIGFAIPTALAKPVIAQLKEFGRAHRGWLGVKIQEVSDEVADSLGLKKAGGALVLDVAKGSPADKAGIVAGDVITSFDGKEISEMRSLPRLVAETKSGKTASITYLHKNASKTTQITISESDDKAEQALGKNGDDEDANAKEKQDGSGNVLGMQLAPLSKDLRARLRVDSRLNGLVVLDVKAGSAAAKRGIMGGDLVVDVNSEPVKTISELKTALENAQKAGRNFALIRVARNGQENFVALPTTEDKK
jgi:serine protease Do